MATVLLRRHLAAAGVDATVSSAGLYEGGAPATDHAVATMADRGLDLTGHGSRQVDAGMLLRADLVLAMARLHVREAAVLAPEAVGRIFTLKELARLAAAVGERGEREPFEAWVARIAATRDRSALLGTGHHDELDVADPVGLGREEYERTADLLDGLLLTVVDLAFPVEARAAEQRA